MSEKKKKGKRGVNEEYYQEGAKTYDTTIDALERARKIDINERIIDENIDLTYEEINKIENNDTKDRIINRIKDSQSVKVGPIIKQNRIKIRKVEITEYDKFVKLSCYTEDSYVVFNLQGQYEDDFRTHFHKYDRSKALGIIRNYFENKKNDDYFLMKNVVITIKPLGI